MSDEKYRAFLDSNLHSDTRPPLVSLYHAVRNIPYGSTGVRDPVEVIQKNFGSCSGKHLLLRDLLRTTGFDAEIITMFTYFNRGMPVHESYPEELRRLCTETDIPDYHHYVRVRRNGDWLKLDATWHDRLAVYGFPVNEDWEGEGDTILAADPIEEYPNVEDLIPEKKRLIRKLSPEDREKRARFFHLVTEWISGL
jgi:hypothetical protein